MEGSKKSVRSRDNKRRSERLTVNFEAEYRVGGAETFEIGRLRDLSPGGFLVSVDREIEPGTELSVILRSSDAELVTEASVLRCVLGADSATYELACVFN